MVLLFSLLTVSSVNAEEETIAPLPRVNDAQVFAEFVDRYPAVLNYFSNLEEAEIIAFYEAQYGKVISKELKRNRLTLFFMDEATRIRVVISQQNNKRQVDVLSELIPEELNNAE